MPHQVSLLPNYIVDMVKGIQLSRSSQYPIVRTEEMGIIFTDVSSFTKITEKVSSKGHYGVEIITEVLHTYFNEMVNCITMFGGDVIKFGGDSIVAIFCGKRDAVLSQIDSCVKDMLIALDRINPTFQQNYGFTISFMVGYPMVQLMPALLVILLSILIITLQEILCKNRFSWVRRQLPDKYCFQRISNHTLLI